MARENHLDTPGLPGGAGWCTGCGDYCGGEPGDCVCCGGEMSEAKRGTLPAGSVHPDEPPGTFRTAENPDAPTDVPVAGEGRGKARGA